MGERTLERALQRGDSCKEEENQRSFKIEGLEEEDLFSIHFFL